MKIGQKIILGYMVVALFIFLLGYLGLKVHRDVEKEFHGVADQTLPVIEALDDLKVAGMRIVASANELAFLKAERAAAMGSFEGEGELIQQGEKQFHKAINELNRLTAEFFQGEKPFVQEIENAGLALLKTADELILLKKQGVVGQEILQKKNQFAKHEQAFLKSVDSMLAHEGDEFTERKEAVDAILAGAFRLIIWAGFLLFATALAIGLYISFSIAKPIVALDKAAQKLGQGKLDERIMQKSNDEIGSLARSFNDMAENLSNVLKDEKARTVELEQALAALRNETEEHRLAEEKRQQLELRLLESKKMESIGTLAGGIAHDFNNLLAAIFGYTDIIKHDLPKDSNTQDDLDQIKKAGERAKELVKQILTFSREGDGHDEMRPLFCHTVLAEALDLLKVTIPSSVEIQQDIKKCRHQVFGNPTQLYRLLMNLCTNAVQAMKEKGVLNISLQETRITADDSFLSLGLCPGDFIELSVADNGPGMDQAIINRIFDPFFTTKEVGQGTGMGLSVVHGLVEKHGGRITVESEPGKGSTFVVLLPAWKGEHVKETITVKPIPTGNERILFVDDEMMLVRMGKRMLEQLGYQVTSTTSSLEALEAFKSQPDKFDLVITDQSMPRMSGDELVAKLLAIKPDIPIILCTGYSSIIDEKSAAEIGVKAFLVKPLEKNEFAVTIRKVLDRKW